MFKNYLLLCTICLFCSMMAAAQTFTINWQKTIGGNGDDILTGIQPTKDKGFIVSGYSNSNKSGNKGQNAYANSYDYWILKLDSTGKVIWNKTAGGNDDDNKPVVLATSDGGFLIGGTSISGKSSTKSKARFDSSYDFWLIKLDSSGNKIFDNTIGGSFCEYLTSLQETSSSYLLGGYSYSQKSHTKSTYNLGLTNWADYWMVKVPKNKNSVTWDRVFGGTTQDVLTSLKVLNDGNYLLAGYSYSTNKQGTKTMNPKGNGDFYLVKTDTTGKQLWDAEYGGLYSDYLTSMIQTNDFGFLLGGYSNSPVSSDKTDAMHGFTDYWVVKTDSARAVKWNKTIGGTKADYLTSVQQTTDSGYILGGYSNSDIGYEKSEANEGGYDYWIVKTDKDGNKVWDKTYGGSGDDKLTNIIETSSNQFLLAGTSNSPVSGDKTAATVGSTGKNDYWLLSLSYNSGSGPKKAQPAAITTLKLPAADANKSLQLTMQAAPNPATNRLTITYNNATAKNSMLSIYNAEGKALNRYTLQNSNGVVHINVASYKAGTYYVSLTSGISTVTRVIVKQ